MHIEQLRNLCLQLPGTEETTPFGPQTLVLKVMGKMYALANIDNFCYINLKCDPETAIELREKHPEITPGYHMNKKHWNSVSVTGALPDAMIIELLKHSYKLVVASLPKKTQQQLRKT